MPLSKTELLTPRVEVIADYPNSPFKIGQILNVDAGQLKENGESYMYVQTEHDSSVAVSEYPHLFRMLPWYEKRDIEDMPEYVKTGLINQRFSKVQWKPMYNGDNIESWKISEDGTFWKNIWSIPTIQPATQEEYEAYIKTKQ